MPPLPCQGEQSALWFSDHLPEQRIAARLCDGCPLSRHAECEAEGWNHEFGVWGGLTPVMRKRKHRGRFDAAVARGVAESLYLDDVVVDVKARVERARLAEAGSLRLVDTIFEVEGLDIAEMLEIGA